MLKNLKGRRCQANCSHSLKLVQQRRYQCGSMTTKENTTIKTSYIVACTIALEEASRLIVQHVKNQKS